MSFYIPISTIYLNKNHDCNSRHNGGLQVSYLLSTNVGYHPCMSSLLPAENKTNFYENRKNQNETIPQSNRLSFLLCRLLQVVRFNLVLFLNASIDHSIHKSSLRCQKILLHAE